MPSHTSPSNYQAPLLQQPYHPPHKRISSLFLRLRSRIRRALLRIVLGFLRSAHLRRFLKRMSVVVLCLEYMRVGVGGELGEVLRWILGHIGGEVWMWKIGEDRMCRWVSEKLEVVCVITRTSCIVKTQLPSKPQELVVEEESSDFVESLMTLFRRREEPGRVLKLESFMTAPNFPAHYLLFRNNTKWPTSKNRHGILP
jgi:hypothetical protein